MPEEREQPHSPSAAQLDPPLQSKEAEDQEGKTALQRAAAIRIKNRRKRYFDTHPEYFSSTSLELAEPLLYERLVRRFQSAAEREAQGRAMGYAGTLEAAMRLSEAKASASAAAAASAAGGLARDYSSNGRDRHEQQPAGGPMLLLLPDDSEDDDDHDNAVPPASKAEGLARWRRAMERRFVRGADADFDYARRVDGSDEWDDVARDERERLEEYLAREEAPSWVLDDDGDGGDSGPRGETGIQDF